MIYFVVRVLVNAVALIVVSSVLPGITLLPIEGLSDSLLPTYLLLGALFGILNGIVRPVVLFMTGNLLITHMAITVFVTNTIIFVALDELTAGLWKVDDFMWLLIAGSLMAGVTLVLEAIFGLDSPLHEDPRQIPFYWRWISRLPTGRRNRIIESLRLRRVYNTIWRYGVDITIDQSPLAGFRQFMQGLIYRRKHAVIDESAAQTVRLMIQELGPTYVKVGQMISSRAEALPPEWRAELEKLQSDVPPFPAEVARSILIRELGRPPEALFAVFEPEPFAAASTAQVHRAVLHSGENVVVKIQRPDILIQVKADFNIMRDVVKVLEKRVQWARDNDLSGILEEFAESVVGELDYTNEAFNGIRLADAMAPFPNVRVPSIYLEYSTKHVLTQEFIKGVKVTDVQALDAAGIDRPSLAKSLIDSAIKQVLFDGFFHGDPHPGNVFVDLSTGDVIFLDLGLVGDLTSEQRLDLINLVWSLRQRDSYSLAKDILKISLPMRVVDERAFFRDIDRLVQRYMVYGDRPRLSAVMRETLNAMYRHGLRMNQSLTIALKAMIQAEEITSVLAPGMRMIEAAFTSVQHLARQQITPQNVASMVETQFNRISRDLVREIPSLQDATMKWIKQYQRGRFGVDVNVETGQIFKGIEDVRTSVERLTVGLILVGLLVASAIASTVPLTEDWSGLSILAFFMFIIAGGFSAYYVFRLLRRMGSQFRDN